MKPILGVNPPSGDRQFQPALWSQIDLDNILHDPSSGIFIFDDFKDYVATTGTTSPAVSRNWSTDREAANSDGTVTLDSQNDVDGIARLNSTTTTNHEGFTAQYRPALLTTSKRSTAADKRGVLVFDSRFDEETMDADTVFIGLSEAGDQFLSATSVIPATADSIGFYTDDAGATWTFYSTNDNAGSTQSQGSFAIPSAYLKTDLPQRFGFMVDKAGGLVISVNGKSFQVQDHGISPDSIPIELLTIRISGTAGGGTTAPTLDIDYVAAAYQGVLPTGSLAGDAGNRI